MQNNISKPDLAKVIKLLKKKKNNLNSVKASRKI